METTLDTAFEAVQELVQTFEANKHVYLKPDYSEAQARKDFLDKFFIALGWDVNHDVQKNPYEQEVKVEIPVIVGATQRHADYAFRLAPNFNDVRFLVEAKKPSASIETKENYFQVVRYGWNSQTPLAVLTDFQQFHVIDCRFVPDPDTALNRSVSTFHYTEYNDREKFALIYWLFSREAVFSGSLQKYAAELPKPRGKAVRRGLFPGAYKPVDESFLEELDEFRTDLARAFKITDPDFDSETLTELTQRTLDRLVFLRFLEDKGIENHNRIDKFGNAGTVWEDFVAACHRLDGIYNGIVFKQHSILDTPIFRVDDAIFGRICERLAAVNTPYDFNSIPIHILGSIYERFLGNVIVATAKRVRIEDKPETRKAGGVYYTPEFISRYIVENTVGKLIADRTPIEIAVMRFADIACGSGSFLLCIYDVLLQYHGSYYNTLSKREQARTVKHGDCIERDGKLYLSLQNKRKILLNNIYGVDIDAQAVEVTQLSLFLRLLQEETTVSTRQYQLDFEHITQMKKLLPDLSKNIVCGNSLINTDILDGQLFPRKEERKLNPMNFEDAFPEVMKRGGFDAVVGNPPYIFTRNEGLSPNEKAYFYQHYKSQSTQLNTFGLFLERSHAIMQEGAYLGYITPNNWLTIDSFAPLRRFLFQNTADLTVVNILDRVFAAADVDTAIVLLRKGNPTNVKLCEMKDQQIVFSSNVDTTAFKPPQFILQISLIKDERAQKLLERVESVSRPLSEFCTVSTGLKAYQTGKGKPRQTDKQKKGRVFHAPRQVNKTYGRYLNGVDVCRYHLFWSGEWLSYGDWLAEPRRSVPFNGERILVRQIPANPPYLVHGILVDDEYFNDINSMVIFAPQNGVTLKYLLGLINSRLLSTWFQKTYDKLQRKIFPQFKVKELARFPIRSVDLSAPADKQKHDDIAAKVEAMLEAKKELTSAKTDKNKNYYEAKCDGLDRQIDRLVYDLYGLTEEEIKLVEIT